MSLNDISINGGQFSFRIDDSKMPELMSYLSCNANQLAGNIVAENAKYHIDEVDNINIEEGPSSLFLITEAVHEYFTNIIEISHYYNQRTGIYHLNIVIDNNKKFHEQHLNFCDYATTALMPSDFSLISPTFILVNTKKRNKRSKND